MSGLAGSDACDAVVVGAGPNGLTAAALLARAGLSVQVIEAEGEPGGGCRSAELTLPGYVHDICSAVHPMGVLSPAFRYLGLEANGVTWARAEVPLAHPLPDRPAAQLLRSVGATAAGLGADQPAWRRLFEPFASEDFVQSLLGPMWDLRSGQLWRKARFGPTALRSCEAVARARFTTPAARVLLAGCAAHACLALDRAGTASFGLVLALSGQVADWPCAVGGSREITRGLCRILRQHGGTLVTGRPVTRLQELPAARAVLFDLSPRQVAAIAGEALPAGYRHRLHAFRRSPGIFKVDWALSCQIPWRDARCQSAMTVHVGGDFDEVLRSERQMAAGQPPDRPFVLVAQQSLFDRSRAPDGRNTGWAYCHVPNGCPVDMTERIEAQIERFAPGFRDCIETRHIIGPAQLEAHNATMAGGDMAGGANDLAQFLFRPAPRWNPYATPNPRLFLCSSSTPPGGGVHGMCGYHAARTVLRRVFGRSLSLAPAAA
jgi:phytoene dehydrogenase-like protein